MQATGLVSTVQYLEILHFKLMETLSLIQHQSQASAVVEQAVRALSEMVAAVVAPAELVVGQQQVQVESVCSLRLPTHTLAAAVAVVHGTRPVELAVKAAAVTAVTAAARSAEMMARQILVAAAAPWVMLSVPIEHLAQAEAA